MSGQRETFFTPDEWKRLVLFRPAEWRQWWSTEPLVTKLLAGAIGVLLATAIYQLLHGDSEVGGALLWVVIALLGVALIAAVWPAIVASVRWAFLRTGITALWHRVGKQVLTALRVLFWLGISAFVLIALWPYLSLDPVRSYYALRHDVPVERVEMVKKPHDCEFTTAPIGEKHCHYDAKALVIPAPDASDSKKAVLVTFQKVDD